MKFSSTNQIDIKKLTIVLLFSFSILSPALSQSIRDTQEFIEEQVDANTPLPNYDSNIFFKGNISKSDADNFAGKYLTEEEFENVFIYSRNVYREGRTAWQWTHNEVIDVRDIKKVSITREEGRNTFFYTVNVYVGGYYHSKQCTILHVNQPEFESLSRMKITIGNNELAAQKIKKAIIHIGILKGISIKDGDLF
jgi:hypothetical protein